MEFCGGGGSTRVHEPASAPGPLATAATTRRASRRVLRGLFTAMQIWFAASELRSTADIEHNPIIVVYTNDFDKLEEIGRSEVIMGTSEPKWATRFKIQYRFQVLQQLFFRIYHIRKVQVNTPVKLLQWDRNECIGEASCGLSQILTSRNHTLNLRLRNDAGELVGSTLTVYAGDSSSRIAYQIKFRCQNLCKSKESTKNGTFVRISKQLQGNTAVPLCETAVAKDNINPHWIPITLARRQYFSEDSLLLIECFDFSAEGDHSLIGSLQTTINKLKKLCGSKGSDTFFSDKGNLKLIKRKKGQLFVETVKEIVHDSFLDYISRYQFKFMVAIDFTASNGAVNSPKSLHHLASGENPYQKAMKAAGAIIQTYNDDSEVSAWGFGAVIREQPKIFFNLFVSQDSSQSGGLKKLLADYQSTVTSVALAGPAYFAPVINRAVQIAKETVDSKRRDYHVLLIVAHGGDLADEQESKDAIVNASRLPVSIIVVGVGIGSFNEMMALDMGFGKKLQSSSGDYTARDMVQFSRVKRDGGQEMSLVVQSLLEKLPGQFLEFLEYQRLTQ